MRDLHIVVVSSSVAKKSLTVTSACDLGVVCHIGLFLVHAVIAKGWHSPNTLTLAPDSFVPFRRSARSTTVVDNSRSAALTSEGGTVDGHSAIGLRNLLGSLRSHRSECAPSRKFWISSGGDLRGVPLVTFALRITASDGWETRTLADRLCPECLGALKVASSSGTSRSSTMRN